VKPFVKTNKNDAADAQAIWTAAQQPEMRTVAVKTEEQQAVLALGQAPFCTPRRVDLVLRRRSSLR